MNIRIATRRSRLALWQAEHVAEQLRASNNQLQIELVPLSTRGDEILDRSLAKIGGKGLFIKELEQAMLDDTADIAVHSMKDVPAELPDGLVIGAVIERHDPRDALVGSTLAGLPEHAVVGTSSLRRMAQLAHNRPDLTIRPLRGNVETRLGKLDDGKFDAIVLAAAGLERLGLAERIAEVLDPATCLPAIGQGAIGVECRADDSAIRETLRAIEHEATRQTVDAERAMNKFLGGSCVSPIAGHAVIEAGEITLRGVVANPDGTDLVAAIAAGSVADDVGREAANLLLRHGARQILDEVADV
ncbi:MAG: hydroxymethylbilane synthase [Gammaproteobacteria bacterium]|nr:hydroxymethylbilane synthase [Gammaproteobacteria bacterium]NNF60200.1 hydroxymethylbilane synthase [Gammaproteobacteria bacterium]NNM21613.1 hydroxymethylbilane synthase [Gammaproteobacteria bacterium]